MKPFIQINLGIQLGHQQKKWKTLVMSTSIFVYFLYRKVKSKVLIGYYKNNNNKCSMVVVAMDAR